ncbi:DNA methyltransferase [Ruminococcus flavefaciens]|uniref:DNA methyltransferase n=1 Tax=Ruminococcus flavefaciens TaxID=1265 RepID=UPI0026ED892A|nr:DNA methyltransferase [Ruminococcus flavefaciens]
MTEKEQKKAAKEFAERWKGRGYEKGESNLFWIDLLTHVYGVDNIADFIRFEDQVHLDHTSFIDGYIRSTRVMIEQKSIGKDLRKAIKQSDGSLLNPFQQAKRYVTELPLSQHPRWIITCNFEEFLIYDMEKPNGEPEQIFLKDLGKDYYRLQFLVETGSEMLKKEMEISLKAGELVGKLYDAILKQYKNPDSPETLKSLNMLCVRLVFCLYAEDAGIFGTHEMFGRYLSRFQAKDVRKALIELFEVLDTDPQDRDPYMDDDLAAFPYVNGGLFADENIEIPRFTDEIVSMLVDNASAGFDWSEISPTIFGAVFESTLNPETRRSGGMHYTSIENIHKVIDPLFLDGLKAEFAGICETKVDKTRKAKLEQFRDKLASLTFLDPACGSGNFLTETYISLRRLENKALKAIHGGQMMFGGEGEFNPIKVGIGQFYGIEINDFAVTVAKTALWIAEAQMMHETEEIIQTNLDFLPLKSYANIVEGNSLRIDWESVVLKDKLSYIMGNPPFVGARLMDSKQKDDVFRIFDGVKNNGNLDYVSCWYKKAADFMTGTTIRTALVSTNSITQGEQVAILWKELFAHGVHIDFAHKTFIWDSEASLKAHVHCVIVGFSKAPFNAEKRLFDNGAKKIVKNINGYLVEADNVIIDSRTQPICNVPEIGIGNKPIDGGFYLFTEEEMKEFIEKEPNSEKYFRKWLGSKEFINGYCRYCLWLGDCPPKELFLMPECLKRVDAVRKFRLESNSTGTKKLAEKPTRFHVENMPKTNYIVVPEVSSEKRKYIPLGFMTPDILCSNLVKLIPNATLYHFGVLTSNVHMAWMRAVAGRLKSDYRYSKDVVYNNFPWCNPTQEQREKIEETAQHILDIRAKYPDCSLADMYGEKMYLFADLVSAHQANDKAVMEAYGFWGKLNTESECVAELMKMYQRLVERDKL